MSPEPGAPIPSSELPVGWSWASLASIATNHDGKRIPVRREDRAKRQGVYPYYGASGVIDHVDDYLFDGHFLLIGEDGANLLARSTPIAFRANGQFWVNNHAHVLQSHGNIPLEFLEHYINSIDLQEYVTGSAQPKLTQDAMNRIPVPLAPLAEQSRIVARIEAADSECKRLTARLSRTAVLLKRFRQAVLASACSGKLTENWRNLNSFQDSAECLRNVGEQRRQAWETAKSTKKHARRYPEPLAIDEDDLPEIPDTWVWASADEVCSQITDGEHIQPRYQVSGFPMITATHVRDGFVEFEEVGLIGSEDFQKCLARCAPIQNDILIVSVGATTGRVAIVQECSSFAMVRSVLMLRPLIQPKFLLRWIQSRWCQTWISQASGASAQPHFYIHDTKRMPVPIPPAVEQIEIVNRVDALFRLADATEKRVAAAALRADRLTQSILAKAFQGELVPTEAELARREGREYEPASVLLERITAAREKKSASSGSVNGRKRRRSVRT